MAELDYNYIAELVERCGPGDADAFAELYASTYQKQYAFACAYLQDPYTAQDALLETYITALKHLGELKDAKLFVSWLSQINFRICYNTANRLLNEQGKPPSPTPLPENRQVVIQGKSYTMPSVMALPFSESQAIFLRYCRNMSVGEIADIMEIRPSAVRRYLSSGKNRLALRPEH